MKSKQIIGLVVAAVMFVFVCGSSMVVDRMTATDNTFNTLMSELDSEYLDMPVEPFVGVVSVEGTIMDGGEASMFSEATYNHGATLEYIDALIKSENNKAILLKVNSPGGSVTASDELYLKLMEYKEATKRPVYTYMGEMACSGGYYISMASDSILGNRNGWTGSIGVILSMTNLQGLYDKLGIKEVNITSGVNKAMGSPGGELSEEQRAILQAMIDESYDQFVEIVATGRHMDENTVRKLADGRIYTVKQAKENGLIDEVVNTYKDAQQLVKDTLPVSVVFYEPKQEENPFATLFSKINQLGTEKKSDTQILEEYLEKQGNGVPMYYAKPR